MATEAASANVDNQLQIMECLISKLADEDLAAIFKCLPPFERLIVSEVCCKWLDVSKTPWRDVSHLDLSQVPTKNIHAVIRKCPSMTSVWTLRQNLGDFCRFVSRLSNVASLSCSECSFTGQNASFNEASSILASLQLTELRWHNCSVRLMDGDAVSHNFLKSLDLPSTLQRLQLVATNDQSIHYFGNVFALPQLDCLILSDAVVSENVGLVRFVTLALRRPLIGNFANLRELFLDPPHRVFMTGLVFALPTLDILFLHNVSFEWGPLERLLMRHRSLRVLVLTASRTPNFDGEITVPARKLFPYGVSHPPVSQLHLFLGKIAAERLRFLQSPADALKIYPIDAPLPEFLEKEEIKEIFQGSWIASRIKEGAKEGVNLADYSFEGNVESISYGQE